MQKILSSAPHMRSSASTTRIMLDVLIALMPASVCAVYFFGLNALILILLSVGTAIAAEALIQLCCKKPVTVNDLSAAVTGLLVALNLPSGVPFYIPVVGSIFAIAIAKQCFGGLGSNFVNPALAARAFLLISWPIAMTSWVTPGVDAVSTATPLAVLQGTTEGVMPSLLDMFLGNIGGCIGEVCSLALLAGGVYLIWKGIISVRIPAAYLGTIAVLTLVFSKGDNAFAWMMYSVLGGGVMLAAFFMATDYTTSPVTPKGQVIYGIGCGVLTVVFRYFGLFPEGVTYAILLMNACVWVIDTYTAPRRFGTEKGETA